LTKSEVECATEFYEALNEKIQAKILHIDDEPIVLKVARQCLEMKGHFQVDSAISVEEAEKKMKKQTYDVIVSDYMMPDRNGFARAITIDFSEYVQSLYSTQLMTY
jgi:CheY-like chemotaxis protein